MIRGVILSLSSFMMLITTACATGRYTDDQHYVGNPERPPATSESSTRDKGERMPADTNPATTR